MSSLSIILAMTEEGPYLRETAEAALSSASACGMDAELAVVSHAAEEEVARQTLVGMPCCFCSFDTRNLAVWNNRGVEETSGEALLFLHEGVILTPESLRQMTDTLLLDPKIEAVGPFSNRTVFTWQYLNAEQMAAEGTDAAAWLRKHLSGPTESLFLETFALLMRRDTFLRADGFAEAFQGRGGADIDLSLRLQQTGGLLLRTPSYLAHRGADSCELYDLTRTEMRAVLLDRWGVDIGVPEGLWREALGTFGGRQDVPLVRATARSALLRTPLVSILIPACGSVQQVQQTIESARSQTYPNIEIVVSDIGADEQIKELMGAYADDLRIRWIRGGERGKLSDDARLIQGEYIQYCAAGDILLPDRITLMMDAYLSHPKAAVVKAVDGVLDAAGNFAGVEECVLPLHGTLVSLDGNALGHEMLKRQENPLGERFSALLPRSALAQLSCTDDSDESLWLGLLAYGDVILLSKPLRLCRRAEKNADACVRRFITWRRLVGEYWRQRVFLTEEEDYQAAQEKLQTDGKKFIDPLLSKVSPALCHEYETGDPPLHIMLMNRVEECTPIRLDAPLRRLALRGDISISGCVQAGAPEIDLFDVVKLHDSILLLERAGLACRSDVSRLISEHAARGNIILQEFDDHPVISKEIVEENYFTFRAVSAVQTSTRYLADFLRAFNPYVYLFENQLEQLPEQRTYDPAQERVTIFFGALNRRPDWEPLMPAVNEVIRRYGDRLQFRVVSDHGFYQALETQAKEFAGGMRDGSVAAPYERYTAALRASDIALLPLNDTEFNRAKSDLKFIEAAGHGAAVLASPVVYAGTVRDGETGLIFRSPKEFAQKLDLLIRRADLRRSLAENAYRYAAEHRLLAQHIDDYIAAYREMFARREELERERRRRTAKFFPNL